MSNDKPKDSLLIFPNVDGMLSDALSILQIELLRMKTKANQNRPLDQKEAKMLQGYIKSLVDLSKEDRERAKDVDLSALSTDELVALLGAKAPKQLTAKPGSENEG